MNNVNNDMYTAPWILFAPMLAITLVTFMCNCLGEGLRKYFHRKA